jgi:hypothetical protein
MMRAMSLRAVLALWLTCVALAGIGGCRSGTERAAEKQVESATVDAGHAAVTVSYEVPADFPKNVPIYPGAKVDLASTATGPNGKPGWSLTLESADPVEAVAAYYKANMGGFTLASDLPMGDTRMLSWQGPSADANLMVTRTYDEKTSISLSVGAK